MPNKNYLSGRRFEYARKQVWERDGFAVMRTAGSRGFYDLIAVANNASVNLIQCKRVKTLTTAIRLAEKFRTSPPLVRSEKYRQVLEIYISNIKKLVVELV